MYSKKPYVIIRFLNQVYTFMYVAQNFVPQVQQQTKKVVLWKIESYNKTKLT